MIEHLVEIERRRLYLSSSCSSLYRYCIDRLGYAEDAALNRHRVALLTLRLPQVLDELRAGTMHRTCLFLLSKHLTADNAAALLSEARGKARREIEQLIARRFPRPDMSPRHRGPSRGRRDGRRERSGRHEPALPPQVRRDLA